jgi:uncharacterized protein YdaU (DUF1376 family)
MTAPRHSLPEPLVPPGTSIGGFPAFLLDAERLLNSDLVALATTEELGAAMILWARAWMQNPPASLPHDPRILASWAKVPLERWKQVAEVALRNFVLCSDGRLYHTVLAQLAVEAAARKRFHGKRAQVAAEARWKQHRSTRSDASSMPKASSTDARRMLGDAKRERDREHGEPPAAAAAAGASRPEGGDATPDRADRAPGSGPAPDPAAAAASINPDANATLRALLGKNGLAASPQATLEWEGMLRRKGLTKAGAIKSFLKFCGKRGDVQFARQAEHLVNEWLAV